MLQFLAEVLWCSLKFTVFPFDLFDVCPVLLAYFIKTKFHFSCFDEILLKLYYIFLILLYYNTTTIFNYININSYNSLTCLNPCLGVVACIIKLVLCASEPGCCRTAGPAQT